SRKFGLGSRLPWDNSWIIEPLSDSTIYMAFYTVCHKFLNNSLDGKASKLNPNDFKPEIWDYIFLNNNENILKHYNFENSTLSLNFLNELKKEFNYWYPVDLRVSSKDLIKNHLTMCL